jgi:chromosome segregation ATPase
MLEYSRSEDERSAYTAQTDFSTSDPGTITPFSRPPSVFGSLTVEQLLRQRQELESSVSLLQEESQRLRISNSDMEQNAAGLVGYLEQLRSQREEAIAEHNGIQEQLGRDLQSLQTELNDTCTARNAARGQLDDIRTAFGAAQDELREAHERISQAKETLANLVSERDAAKSQLDTISHSRDRVSLELAERKAELHQTTESSQQEHRRLDGLRHESATLASSFEQARSEHASIMRHIQGEEKDALARLSTLRTTTEKEAKSRTLAVTEQERRERQALEALRSETSEAQRLHKTDLTRMQTETKDAQASIAKVQTELRTAKTSLTEQKRLHVKAVADLDVITAQRGKVEQEARTAAEEAAQAKDAALLARQELGRLNTAIQEGTARLARVTTSGSQERVHTPATPIALSVPQGADSFSQAQQTSYHGAHGRASADRSGKCLSTDLFARRRDRRFYRNESQRDRRSRR